MHLRRGAQRLAMTATLLVTACSPNTAAGTTPATGTPSPEPASAKATDHLSGVVFVEAANRGVEGLPCQPKAAFADVSPGSEVVVRDQADVIVGKASLLTSAYAPDRRHCKMPFEIDAAPSSFYQLKIGTREGPT